MADEKKDESKKTAGPWSPQWGRGVTAFTLLPTATWRCGSDMLQSGKVGRDGVTAMELHPLGVLVTAGKGEQQIVPAGSMTDIRLA